MREEPAESVASHSLTEIDLSSKHAANGAKHFAGRFTFGYETVGAGPNRAFCMERFIVHRKDQHSNLGIADMQILNELQAVRVLQRKTGDDEIWLVPIE